MNLRSWYLERPIRPIGIACRNFLSWALRKRAAAMPADAAGLRDAREGDQRTNALVELSPDGIFVYQAGIVVFANSAAAEIHGAGSTDRLIGMQAIELVHPEAHAEILRRRRVTEAGGLNQPIVRTGVRLDGTYFTGESRGSSVNWNGEAAILVVVRDVSEREQAREILRESEIRLRGILENVADSVITIDESGIVQSFNPAAESIFGYPADEVIGRNVSLLMPEPDHGRHDGYLKGYTHTGAGRIIGIGPREVIARRRDGAAIEVELTVAEMRVGGTRTFIGAIRDITERKQAETALRDSEARFRDLIEGSELGIQIANMAGKRMFVNRACARLFGYESTEKLMLEPDLMLVAEHDRERVRTFRDRTFDSGTKVCEFEFDGLHKDGSIIPTYVYYRRIVWEGQDAVQRTFIDLTERKRAEQALLDSEARFRDLIEGSLLAVQIKGQDGKRVYVNQAFLDLFGYATEEEVYRQEFGAFVAPHHLDDVEKVRRARESGDPAPSVEEFDARRKDGSVFPVQVFVRPIVWQGERAHHRTYIDLTERKQAEKALRDSEARYRSLFEISPDAVLISDFGKILFCNPAAIRLFGAERPEQLIGMNHLDLIHSDDRPRIRSRIDQGPDRNSPMSTVEIRRFRIDGTEFFSESRSAPFIWNGDAVRLVFIRDITERKQAETALRDSEARYRDLIEGSELGIQITTRDGRRVFANRAFAQLFGYESPGELMGMPPRGLLAHHDRAGKKSYREAFFEDDAAASGYELDGMRKDGSIIPLHAFMRRVIWDGEAAVQRTYIDLTERKKAEEQLRQAQKMEVVGQLTGGVAHDFNNLLTVILGNLDLLQGNLEDPAMRRMVKSAMDASSRAAELTQRLLAFSRKQALKPRPTDVTDLVDGMADLMRRSLGETIEIEIAGGDDVWQCEIDPAQLENAILNLAINARDAMPRGGRLTIGTANVAVGEREAAAEDDFSAGEYVMISVADNGVGMALKVVERAFEPFFTTKDVGEGSGLGLSMVYGFIKQSGGHVAIDSEPDKGTVVKLYLKRSYDQHPAAEPGVEAVEPLSRGETILVVEDDAEVRTLIVKLLAGLGYAIEEAADGGQAIEVLETTPAIDLLFTDVVLPGGMSGADVAVEATARVAGIKVLYASGYNDNILAREGQLDPAVQFISKPFRRGELAHKVRAVLDGAAA